MINQSIHCGSKISISKISKFFYLYKMSYLEEEENFENEDLIITEEQLSDDDEDFENEEIINEEETSLNKLLDLCQQYLGEDEFVDTDVWEIIDGMGPDFTEDDLMVYTVLDEMKEYRGKIELCLYGKTEY